MKIREIISERNEKLDEFLGFGILGAAIWRLVVAYEMSQPIVKAWNAMNPAYTAYKNNDPNMTYEQFEQVASHALAQCSIELGGMILGNKLIGGLVGKLAGLKVGGPIIGYFSNLFKTLGQYEFMSWLNTEEVSKVVGDWLTGLIFTEKFPILGKSGPLYEKYVGGGLLKALEEIKPGTEKLKNKIFNKPEQPTQAQTDIGATSTPPATPAAKIAKQTPAYDYGDLRVTPGLPGAPERFNVSFK